MTAKELYDQIGGDYQEALRRFSADPILAIFLKKYAQDQTYHDLMEAIHSGDRKEIFTAAHSFKGVTGNMAFARLHQVTCDFVDAVRPLDKDPDPATIQNIEEMQSEILSLIACLP